MINYKALAISLVLGLVLWIAIIAVFLLAIDVIDSQMSVSDSCTLYSTPPGLIPIGASESNSDTRRGLYLINPNAPGVVMFLPFSDMHSVKCNDIIGDSPSDNANESM